MDFLKCVCVCVLLLLHKECQNLHSTGKERTFFESEDMLAGPHNIKVLFEG